MSSKVQNFYTYIRGTGSNENKEISRIVLAYLLDSIYRAMFFLLCSHDRSNNNTNNTRLGWESREGQRSMHGAPIYNNVSVNTAVTGVKLCAYEGQFLLQRSVPSGTWPSLNKTDKIGHGLNNVILMNSMEEGRGGGGLPLDRYGFLGQLFWTKAYRLHSFARIGSTLLWATTRGSYCTSKPDRKFPVIFFSRP